MMAAFKRLILAINIFRHGLALFGYFEIDA